jgi:hypothetical protein
MVTRVDRPLIPFRECGGAQEEGQPLKYAVFTSRGLPRDTSVTTEMLI